MRKIVFALCLPFLMAPASIDAGEIKHRSPADACTITCTIMIEVNGVNLGFSATAGGMFTDCATAGDRACKKALKNVYAVLEDMI